MEQQRVCIRPVTEKDKIDLSFIHIVDLERIDHVNNVMPYEMGLEVTSKCRGACAYCYASSTHQEEYTIPTEKCLELIDQAAALGIRLVNLLGGCPLEHPDWEEIVTYCADKGIKSWLNTSGILSRKVAAKIVELSQKEGTIEMVINHIDTINPEVYNKLHTNPKSLDMKIQGYRNLLEAGYPADRICMCITMSKPALDVIEETIDWYIDEMGCKSVIFIQYKEEGFGIQYPEWHPSLANIRRALEYRAKRLGDEWLQIGASDASHIICRTNFYVLFDGRVAPCAQTRDLAVGNIYEQTLEEIFARHRDHLLFNIEIKGYCGGPCQYSYVCYGCRAVTYHALGDMAASDPKCPFNPDAREPIDFVHRKTPKIRAQKL